MQQRAKLCCRWRIAARLTAVAAALAAVMALPFDWVRLCRAATLVAAGMQRPQNAAAVWEEYMTVVPTDTAVSTPPLQAAPTTTTAAVTTAPATVPTVPVISINPPPADGSGGSIVTRKIATGDSRRDGIAFRNSSGKAVDIAAALKAKLAPQFTQTQAPQVLIVHTHTTEGYMTYDAGYYNAADRQRTTQHSRSVCAVGAALKAALAQHGIVALHDTTVHDAPQYAGAYTRSAKTVQGYLKQYPSIQVVLDLHRDALMEGETTLVKPTVTVEGKKAAQIMIIAGVLGTEALPHPYTAQNLAFAAQWQQLLDKRCAGLARPLSTVGSRYNQHLHAGYLLVEVGSEANTVAEAVYSAQLLGKTLAELL